MANQASMARRQRERKRMQKRREKQALRDERREAKKLAEKIEIPADPMQDPTIDWGAAVRRVTWKIPLSANLSRFASERLRT